MVVGPFATVPVAEPAGCAARVGVPPGRGVGRVVVGVGHFAHAGEQRGDVEARQGRRSRPRRGVLPLVLVGPQRRGHRGVGPLVGREPLHLAQQVDPFDERRVGREQVVETPTPGLGLVVVR